MIDARNQDIVYACIFSKGNSCTLRFAEWLANLSTQPEKDTMQTKCIALGPCD